MSDTPTVTMNVSLPAPLKGLVDGQVARGLYGSASEFVREAIREKMRRDEERDKAARALTAALLHGLKSKALTLTEDSVAQRRAAHKARLRRTGRAA